MSRKAAFHVVVVLLSAFATGCVTPGSIKQASSLQLEAFSSTQQSIDSYVDLVDKEITAIQALRSTSLDFDAVVKAVEAVAADPDVTANPVAALDSLSNEFADARQASAEQPDSLAQISQQHRENLGYLKNLLKLFQKNQELVNLYLTTDLGPSNEQITGLSDGLKSLKQVQAGGGQ